MRLAALLVVMAGAAMAEDNPITGTYADAGGCARLAGEAATTDMVFILTPDKVERYETICEIARVVLSDGIPAKLELTCMGEGESWTDSYLLAPLDGEDGFVASIPDAPEIAFELRRCE